MRILILSRKFEIYSTRRLVEEFSQAGHTVLLWDPGWPLKKFRGGSFDVLIPRLGSFRFEEALEVVEALSSRSGLVANSVEAYRKARNKWASYIAFLEGKIPTPFSLLVSDRDTSSWTRGFPCIVKELESSKGEGVFLANSADELLQITSRLSSSEYLIQEAFAESFGEDIRVFVVNGKIIASMKRKSSKDFRSNLAQGGVGEICTLTEAETALALNAASVLGLQIAGVDILRTHKGSLILEANPCPGLEGIEKYTLVNVARAIIKFIEELHHGHSS